MAGSAPDRKWSLNRPPIRSDLPTLGRRSLDVSPSQSSIQSSQIPTPSSSVSNTPLLIARAASPEKRSIDFDDTNNFLTALAAQERRVLELREELQKAEGDLERLKKQWASREAAKKRNEIRHLEQLQPLKTNFQTSRPLESDPRSVTRELDRRGVAPASLKTVQRTVFSGSRHARALSLLSSKDSETDTIALPRNLGRNHGSKEHTKTPFKAPKLGILMDGLNESIGPFGGVSKEPILETGKQLVGDFRQGLWTFLEDLKQVTVGDEASNISDSRSYHTLMSDNLPKPELGKKGVPIINQIPNKRRHCPDVRSDFAEHKSEWSTYPEQYHPARGNETGLYLASPLTSADHDPNERCDTTNGVSSDTNEIEYDESWENWESMTSDGSTPRRKKTPFAGDPMSSPLAKDSSPKTSTSFYNTTPHPQNHCTPAVKTNDLPWPPLFNLSPRRLTRTASTLMSEWERSLAPPATNEEKYVLETNSKDHKTE